MRGVLAGFTAIYNNYIFHYLLLIFHLFNLLILSFEGGEGLRIQGKLGDHKGVY